jgi:hypothetical protein
MAMRYAQSAMNGGTPNIASYANAYNQLREANPDQFYDKMRQPTAVLEKVLNDVQFEDSSPLARLADLARLTAEHTDNRNPGAKEAALERAQQLKADLPYKVRVIPTPPINVAGSVMKNPRTGVPESFNIYTGSMDIFKEPEKALEHTLAHEGAHYYGLDRPAIRRFPLGRAETEATADGMARELLSRAGIRVNEHYGSSESVGDGYFDSMLSDLYAYNTANLDDTARTPAGRYIDTLDSLHENQSLGTIDRLKKMIHGYKGR